MMTVVTVTMLLGGCKNKEEKLLEQGAVAAQPEKNAPPTLTGAKAVKWEKVERVPFAKLQSILPEGLAGMKRTNLGGSTVPDGDATYTEGVAEFEGQNESGLTLTIQDHPVRATESLSSKTTVWKGYPVVSESENSDSSELGFVVGDRFMVVVQGRKLKVAQVKAALEKVDFQKLASWKLEGLPK